MGKVGAGTHTYTFAWACLCSFPSRRIHTLDIVGKGGKGVGDGILGLWKVGGCQCHMSNLRNGTVACLFC